MEGKARESLEDLLHSKDLKLGRGFQASRGEIPTRFCTLEKASAERTSERALRGSRLTKRNPSGT